MSVSLAIAFIFCVIIGRFFYIQAVWGSDLVIMAADQWNREVPVIAARGEIYDRNGIVLAGNENTYSVFVRPNAVVDKTFCATVLAGIFGLDVNEVLAKISKTGVSEVTVVRHASHEDIVTMISYDIDGVYYARDNTREYTYGDVLCQVLGFTSVDGTGISGLEKYYNSLLAGTNGEILYSTDIVGVETEDPAIVYSPATDGSGIMLTIDAEIQLAAEQAMREVYTSSGAKSVSCIVLDPQSFEILALVNYPSYDLNDVPRDDTETLNSLSRNKAVVDIYEPGSTFKVITAAANLEEYLQGNASAFSPSYVFNSSRTRSVDGTTIKMVRLCDLARIGFGQTIAVTQLQLACAVAAAVNGGNYYVPRLLDGVVSPDGTVEEIETVLKTEVISEQASRMLAQMLEGVVTEGSGKNAYIEGYKVGGKTGTAQKYEDGKIAAGKYVSSFVGFFPSDNPRYLALITVDEPQGTYYGSAVAAPVAKEIFQDIITIKNIQPYE